MLWKLCGLGSLIVSATALGVTSTIFRTEKVVPIANGQRVNGLDVISLQIDLLSLMLAIAGVVLAILGVFGYQTIKDEAIKAATAAAVERAMYVVNKIHGGGGLGVVESSDISQNSGYKTTSRQDTEFLVGDVSVANAKPLGEDDSNVAPE